MELPESLDETYERILMEIKKPNRGLARRVLQCLVVATRPLRVVELAEVLAVDFDDAEGISRLNSDWRWEDQEQALLIACSSLITIVEANHGAPEVEAGHSHLEAEINDGDSHIEASNSDSGVKAGHSDSEAETDDGDSHIEADDSRIVQFSHFSVKEFLTSSRLSTASGEVSNYHIDLEPAHTILAQACLGVLLRIQDGVEGCTPMGHPLARYAAEHWTTHAQFGEVSSRLHKGMEYFFDLGKPHFKAWLTVYDIDTNPVDSTFYQFTPDCKSPATPLYYAALCGFHDLVEHFITKNPQDVNADGGYYMRPLVAALAGEHFQTADLLHHNGADLDVRGYWGKNSLHAAAYSGNFEVVRVMIEYNPAVINARDDIGWTPLLRASGAQDGSVLRLLLEHGADINVRDNRTGETPLQWASLNGALQVVRLLLEHGADVEAKDKCGMTALQVAVQKGYDEVVELLREHGAKYSRNIL